MSSITKECAHRLMLDVRDIMRNPLSDNGIYYSHDEGDMLKGYAMIVGPEDTPYFGGFYFFRFQFPSDYPYSPPTVTYHTNDGHIRFNPNLYGNGKVCISILNTWRGEPWSPCQTISTVLLTLCTILCKDPLKNEPGISHDCSDIQPYNQVIEHANVRVAICDTIDKSRMAMLGCFSVFNPDIERLFEANYDKVLAFLLDKYNANKEVRVIRTRVYGLCEIVDYSKLRARYVNNKLK